LASPVSARGLGHKKNRTRNLVRLISYNEC